MQWTPFREMDGYPLSSTLSSHGSAPDNIWLLGEEGLFRFDGSSFTEVALPPTPSDGELIDEPLDRILTLAANDAWLTRNLSLLLEDQLGHSTELWHYDGQGWSQHFTSASDSEEERTWAEASYSEYGGRLYARRGATLYRYEAGTFVPVVEFPAGRFFSMDVEGDAIWFHSDNQLSRYADDSFSDFGDPVLSNIGVTEDALWSYDGRRVRRRPR
jgi:hypothetical protein